MPIQFGEEIERNWNIFRSTSLKDVDLLLEALQDQSRTIWSENNKTLFTDRCRWQNFCTSLLHLVNKCIESIYLTQKTWAKALPSAMIGE